MAKEDKIRVSAYCGHRADERPLSFWYGKRQIPVKRILRRWYEEGAEVGGGRRSCFQVEGEDGRIYRLCYRHKEGAWFLAESP